MFELFQYDFMIRAFVAGAIVAIIAPLIGSFFVVRGYSLIADTLSHVALAGVAIGLLFNVYPLFSALLVTVLVAVLLEKLRKDKTIRGESALALFLSGSLALAVVLVGLSRGFNVNLFNYLFGSVTTVSPQDLWLIGGLGLLVLAVIILFYKEFFFISFDEELAQVQGIPTLLFNIILMVLGGVTIVLSMRIVGLLLTGALMVIPVLTAMQLGHGFLRTILSAVAFSLFATVMGLFLSYYYDLASGGTIVLVAVVLFAAVYLLKKRA